MTSPATMTLEEFQAYMADRVGRSPAELAVDADLRTEIELDSLEMFFLLVAVEDLGVRVPEELMPHIRTLSDAYHQLITTSGHRP